MINPLKRALLALQFMTIIPLRIDGEVTEKDMAGSAVYFPLAGVVQGTAAVGTAIVCLEAFSAELSAAFVLLVLILVNGGFDLDGLCDTADALSVKASGDPEADRQKRLAVMKDSHTGAIGVIALIMSILIKFLLIKRVLVFGGGAYAALFLAPVFSKWITVPAMHHSGAARNDGLGRIFIEGSKASAVTGATVLTAFVSAGALFYLFPGRGLQEGLIMTGTLLLSFYAFCLMIVNFLGDVFGGLTGDHCGALTEVTEILFLTAVPGWL